MRTPLIIVAARAVMSERLGQGLGQPTGSGVTAEDDEDEDGHR